MFRTLPWALSFAGLAAVRHLTVGPIAWGLCCVGVLSGCAAPEPTPPRTSAIYQELPEAEPVEVMHASVDEPEERIVARPDPGVGADQSSEGAPAPNADVPTEESGEAISAPPGKAEDPEKADGSAVARPEGEVGQDREP